MKRSSGFTMIEVIVIVAVIAILAGILTPMVMKEVAKARVSRSRADMEAIATAFTQYFADTGVWPDNYTGATDTNTNFVTYQSLFRNSVNLASWDGPYFQRAVDDGSGNNVVARNTGGGRYVGSVDAWGRPFRISYGRIGGAIGGPGGAIAVVSPGPNGAFDVTNAQALSGIEAGDDLVRVITRRVR